MAGSRDGSGIGVAVSVRSGKRGWLCWGQPLERGYASLEHRCLQEVQASWGSLRQSPGGLPEDKAPFLGN